MGAGIGPAAWQGLSHRRAVASAAGRRPRPADPRIRISAPAWWRGSAHRRWARCRRSTRSAQALCRARKVVMSFCHSSGRSTMGRWPVWISTSWAPGMVSASWRCRRVEVNRSWVVEMTRVGALMCGRSSPRGHVSATARPPSGEGHGQRPCAHPLLQLPSVARRGDHPPECVPVAVGHDRDGRPPKPP